MKPILTYYGGKQKLANRIVANIPEHHLYTEPFFGGGAVFFAKPKSPVEVINDTNREVVNFYKTVQYDFVSLEKEIKITLHSRDLHRKAQVIYHNPDMFPELKRAWAVWTLATQSFTASLDNTWGYALGKNSQAKKIQNKRESFTYEYAVRLQDVQVESTDAIKLIRTYDSEKAFHYCDPPYYQTDMGHYDGYTLEDFGNLLKTLSEIKGKFLLSSYPSQILTQYTQDHSWYQIEIDQPLSAGLYKGKARPKKTEVLTANYQIKL